MVFLSRARIVFFLALVEILSLAILKNVLAQELMIVEIKIGGNKASEDFIKIFNFGKDEIDVSGYKLKKRVSTGKEYLIKTFPVGSKIPAAGYFLWANSQENFHLIVNSNVWSEVGIAKNNSVALFNKEEKILDAVAWGSSINPFYEAEVFPENPGKNQILKRKESFLGFQDTNNNKEDFYLTEKTIIPEENKTEEGLEISLFLPKEVPINKEFEVKILISNPKKGIYDLKVAIEKDDKIISEIFNEKEKRWVSSHYYLKNFFDDSLTEKTVKIRIKEEKVSFVGEAEAVVRIRESGKSKYLEKRESIFLSSPEKENDFSFDHVSDPIFNEKNRKTSFKFSYIFGGATALSFFAGTIALILKRKLKVFKN